MMSLLQQILCLSLLCCVGGSVEEERNVKQQQLADAPVAHRNYDRALEIETSLLRDESNFPQYDQQRRARIPTGDVA